MKWVLIGLVHWLGYGRAIEAYFATVCLSYGIALATIQDAAWSSQAVRDLLWVNKVQYLAYLMILKGIISFYGVIANINDWRFSRETRIAGAVLGTWVWVWFVTKFALVDFPYTLGTFFAGIAVFFCIRTVGLAYLNIPRPGL